ncbi:MAG: hypothetical protein D4R74_13300 [Betaproteobacteria bacterium]|nr:MAG: hypothetical protein D4R74_13300 [Betaproteobacteria bacterium]
MPPVAVASPAPVTGALAVVEGMESASGGDIGASVPDTAVGKTKLGCTGGTTNVGATAVGGVAGVIVAATLALSAART